MSRFLRSFPLIALVAALGVVTGLGAQETQAEHTESPQAHSQRVRMQMPDEAKFTVTAENGVPEIPFKLVNNHLILPIRINDKGTVNAVLDTGMPAPGLALHDGPWTRDLGLTFDPNMQVRVQGAGGDGGGHEARMALGAKLELEGLSIDKARIIVLPAMEDFAGYHNAIIGYSLFERFAVELDYDRQVVRLHEPGTYEAPAGAHVVPFSLRQRIPFVSVRVTPYDGEPFDAEVVVDLGASHAISLNTGASEKIAVPERSLRTVLGHGLSGPVEGEVGRLAALELGGARFSAVVASFPVGEHQNPRGMDSRAGNLGSEILRRFTTVFDYSRQQLILVPNESFDEPFEWDHSGLRLGVGKVLEVESVLAGSPAEAAGVRVGDVVTHVNGRPVTSSDYGDVRDALMGTGEVRLMLARDGKSVEASIALRRMI